MIAKIYFKLQHIILYFVVSRNYRKLTPPEHELSVTTALEPVAGIFHKVKKTKAMGKVTQIKTNISLESEIW